MLRHSCQICVLSGEKYIHHKTFDDIKKKKFSKITNENEISISKSKNR